MTTNDASEMAACYRDYEGRVPEGVLAEIQATSKDILDMEQRLQEWVITQPLTKENET